MTYDELTTETGDDVTIEIDLPFWIDASDIYVNITSLSITVDVRNTLSIRRTYWRNRYDSTQGNSCPSCAMHPYEVLVCEGRAVAREEEGRRKDYAVVDVEESLWSLDDEEDAQGQAIKLLMITLVKPPLSEDEVMWKKGKRRKRTACAKLSNFKAFLVADIISADMLQVGAWTTGRLTGVVSPARRVFVSSRRMRTTLGSRCAVTSTACCQSQLVASRAVI